MVSKIEVTSWTTDGLTLAQLEATAKKVRGMKMDLVIVAIPATADSPNLESRMRSYAWVLNGSLSFGHQQWDVIGIPPSTTKGKLSPEELKLDQFARRLIAAQDLGMITRDNSEQDAELRAVVRRWLKEQTNSEK
jgi:hypothetical protein